MEGTPFGRYRLQHLIGRGGMGEVWRAYDEETQRVVAIKLLAASVAADDEFTERFRREARMAAVLNSPHVVPIHNFGEIDGRLYVDMQLIPGRDLQADLDDGPLRPEQAVQVIEQVAAALRVAHAAGLVHRDVKPSNILLNDDDFTYLIDFGLARGVDDDTGLTVSGHTVGTFAYMAPERYEGGPVDARTDVYSLACVLFECLTGRRPFTGSRAQQMLAHVSTPPPKPTESVPGLPDGFDAVIAVGMAKDVAERYQTIDEFARAARRALAQEPAAGAPPVTEPWQRSEPERAPRWRRRPVLVAAALLVVALVAVTATVLAMRGPRDAVTVGGATYLRQTNINSDGLYKIDAITTNQSGAVVGLCCMASVFKIADEAKPPTINPLNLMVGTARSIAVDDQGNGYLAATDGTVLRLDGALKPTSLPFPPTDVAIAIGVDGDGDVFVLHVDVQRNVFEVFELPFGARDVELLPFDTSLAKHMAVAPDGTVYVDNLNSATILKLAPGDKRPTGLPFPHESDSDAPVYPRGLATDAEGALYLAAESADGNLVYRYAPGERAAEALPIRDLNWESGSPVGLAVDGVGNVFVVDQTVNRIVKLPRYRG